MARALTTGGRKKTDKQKEKKRKKKKKVRQWRTHKHGHI
jgi:hypothetical protein